MPLYHEWCHTDSTPQIKSPFTSILSGMAVKTRTTHCHLTVVLFKSQDLSVCADRPEGEEIFMSLWKFSDNYCHKNWNSKKQSHWHRQILSGEPQKEGQTLIPNHQVVATNSEGRTKEGNSIFSEEIQFFASYNKSWGIKLDKKKTTNRTLFVPQIIELDCFNFWTFLKKRLHCFLKDSFFILAWWSVSSSEQHTLQRTPNTIPFLW